MKSVKPKYIRNDHFITELITNKHSKKIDLKSINLAKKFSRKTQLEIDGGLGRGTVVIGW